MALRPGPWLNVPDLVSQILMQTDNLRSASGDCTDPGDAAAFQQQAYSGGTIVRQITVPVSQFGQTGNVTPLYELTFIVAVGRAWARVINAVLNTTWVIDNMPEDAVDYEWEGPATLVDQVTVDWESLIGMSSAVVSSPVGIQIRKAAQSDYTFEPLGDLQVAWWTPGQLTGMQLVVSGPLRTYESETVYQDSGLTPMSMGGVHQVVLAFCINRVAAGESWAAPADPDGLESSNASMERFVLHVTSLQPRVRYLYEAVPPLRQWPRDDGQGGHDVRQLSRRSSRQHTDRQGWAGTYL